MAFAARDAPDRILVTVCPSSGTTRQPWNTFQIVLRGDRLSVRLNGQLVLDDAQLPGIPARGPIALHHHGDREDGEWGASFLQFRNLSITELDQASGQ